MIAPYDHPEEADAYRGHGLTVVPIRPGTKRSLVRWKAFQTQPPTADDVGRWWRRWPDAGVAVVLGPVSDVLAVDVDGPDAHAALVEHLGAEPVAPKVLTGSGRPSRYQLLFRHPAGVPTRAKVTPWHPQLEFRGRGGLSVLPPSVHPSGKRYRWAAGRSLDELELPDLPPAILDALVTPADAAADPGADREAAPGRTAAGGLHARSLALIRKTVTSVEGRGGDKAAYTAACYLVVDFGLSVDESLPLLRAWNRTNCRPGWTDDELRHKLEMADATDRPRGRLLGGPETSTPDTGRSPRPPAVPAPSAASIRDRPGFYMTVPDWVLSCWGVARPAPPPPRRGRPRYSGLDVVFLVFAAVVLQRSSVVCLPDVVLAQLRWGGDRGRRPRRWRAQLRLRFATDGARRNFAVSDAGRPCPPGCPLHGSPDVRHRHVRFRVTWPVFLTAFAPFAVAGTPADGLTYEFTGMRSHHPDPKVAKTESKVIRDRRAGGALCGIYLPAWVFGPHVLPPGPCRLLKAVTHELTRRRDRRADREDRAEVVVGSAHPSLFTPRRCPQ